MDTSDDARLELVYKFCYLGDMLSVDGHADAAMEVTVPKTHTHTHTQPFNGLFSRTTWVSRYQKGKTNLDFTEARDSE